MREILFRAKQVNNGEWVEGYFAIGKWYLDEKERYAILPIDLCFYPHCEINEWIEIDPETVCQYTGLKDKNGKRIWENDIVRIENSMDEGIGNIEFYGGMWYVDGEPSNSLYDIVEYDDGELEVIGNIFDTPELLKGGLTCRN